jgi:hypothetical protein
VRNPKECNPPEIDADEVREEERGSDIISHDEISTSINKKFTVIDIAQITQSVQRRMTPLNGREVTKAI